MAARGMSVFFPMKLSAMEYSSSYVGFLFALLFGSGIFGQYFGGYFSDKHSKKVMIAYLSLASSTLLFVSFFIQNLFALAILMLVAGFAKDAIWPPFFSLSTENVSRKSYGTTLGVFFSVGFIMSSQASVIMGIVWDHFSFLASVSLLLIFGVAATLVVKQV
jgi:MFS family permease